MGGLLISPYGGVPRLVRGWAVGATATGLALAGHTIAGGSAPTARTLLVITALAAAPCAVMSSLEWSVRRLAGVLLIAQAGLHLTFGITSSTHQMGSALPMLAWHLVATAVAVAVLRGAEATLVDVVDRVALRRRDQIICALPCGARPVPAMVSPLGCSLASYLAATSLPARGPPVLS